MYRLIKSLLFTLPPETAHDLSIGLLKIAQETGAIRLLPNKAPQLPTKVMGINFINPIGLGAGLDKNGDAVDGLSTQGFGFLELGTVTPRPQPGNPKPRLFRLPEVKAIINRFGFNNKGVDYLVDNIKARRFNRPIGINIGKNFNTPVEEADNDYLICLEKIYPYTDYVAINVSSPNTPDLRTLQFGDSLKRLLETLKERQYILNQRYARYVPLTVKIAPDISDKETIAIAKTLLEMQIDGVIATNTTVARDAVAHLTHGQEAGGLSGTPLLQASNHTLKLLADTLQGKLPIIASGGVMSAEHAVQKLQAGASLVQIYTGYIYHGYQLINDSVAAIKKSGMIK